jgi:hypothetical protein
MTDHELDLIERYYYDKVESADDDELHLITRYKLQGKCPRFDNVELPSKRSKPEIRWDEKLYEWTEKPLDD